MSSSTHFSYHHLLLMNHEYKLTDYAYKLYINYQLDALIII